jgi:hypothetical protein
LSWELFQLLVRHGWAIGKLLPQKVKVASVKDGMCASKGSSKGAGEAGHLSRCVSKRAGYIADVAFYGRGISFKLISKSSQIIPSLGFTKHAPKRPFCVYGLMDFREPSSPNGRDSQLMQVGQIVRSEDQFAEVGPSQNLCAAAEVLFDFSSCP